MNQRKIDKIEKNLYKELCSFYDGDGLFVTIENSYFVDMTSSIIITGTYGRRKGDDEQERPKDYFFEEYFCLLFSKGKSMDYVKGMFGEILWERLDFIAKSLLS